MAINKRLNNINNEVLNIKQAIIDKGQTVSTLDTFADAIANISGGGEIPDYLDEMDASGDYLFCYGQGINYFDYYVSQMKSNNKYLASATYFLYRFSEHMTKRKTYTFDFNNLDLSECTSFYYSFSLSNNSVANARLEILNFDMRAVSEVRNMFNFCSTLKKLTFKDGSSFGGLSNISSLTLNLSYVSTTSTYGMDKNGYIEMFNSLGTNTNGRTRIFKIPSPIYNELTDEEKAIATNKGYSLAT